MFCGSIPDEMVRSTSGACAYENASPTSTWSAAGTAAAGTEKNASAAGGGWKRSSAIFGAGWAEEPEDARRTIAPASAAKPREEVRMSRPTTLGQELLRRNPGAREHRIM